MKRRAPAVTPGQAASVAAASRARVQLGASAERQQREQQAAERAFEKLRKRFAQQMVWQQRYGHWLARALLVPLVVLAALSVAAVVMGAWSGEIKVVSRFSSDVVLRVENPVRYWWSVVYHGSLASLLVWLSYLCARASKLRRNASAT